MCFFLTCTDREWYMWWKVSTCPPYLITDSCVVSLPMQLLILFLEDTHQICTLVVLQCIYLHTNRRISHGKHYQAYLNSPPRDQTSSYIHANKRALSDRLEWNQSEWSAEMFVWTHTMLTLMDWYAGWASSTLKHLIIPAARCPLPGESCVNKWGMKTRRHTRWNLSPPRSRLRLSEYVQ